MVSRIQRGAIESLVAGIVFGFWMHSFLAGIFMIFALSMFIVDKE